MGDDVVRKVSGWLALKLPPDLINSADKTPQRITVIDATDPTASHVAASLELIAPPEVPVADTKPTEVPFTTIIDNLVSRVCALTGIEFNPVVGQRVRCAAGEDLFASETTPMMGEAIFVHQVTELCKLTIQCSALDLRRALDSIPDLSAARRSSLEAEWLCAVVATLAARHPNIRTSRDIDIETFFARLHTSQIAADLRGEGLQMAQTASRTKDQAAGRRARAIIDGCSQVSNVTHSVIGQLRDTIRSFLAGIR